MDLGELIRHTMRQAGGRRHVASAVNVGRDGHTTSVHRDDEATTIRLDGKTHVIRHDEQEKP